MSERVYLLPLWLRIWHWTNASLVVLLIATGVSLHFSDPKAMLVPFSLARDLHNIAGIGLCVAYAFFVVANILSGNWWQFVPKPKGFGHKVWVQVRYYMWDMFKGAELPYPPTQEHNFNALQQLMYWLVMYMLMPAQILTGLIFLWPEWAPDRVLDLDGLLPIAMAHYVFAIFVLLFLLGHIYLGTAGVKPLSGYKMIVTGWHEH